jgi:thiol-disulfide isomerase/thioredoxin
MLVLPATLAIVFCSPAAGDVEAALAKFDKAVATLRQAGTKGEDAYKQAADEALQDVDIASLDFESMDLLVRSRLVNYTTQTGKLRTRLAELAKDEGPDGAMAALHVLGFLEGAGMPQQKTALCAVLDHPSLRELLESGRGWEGFEALSSHVSPEAMRGREDDLIALADSIPESVPVLGALGAVALFDRLASAGVEPARREPLRKNVVALLDRTLAHVDPKDPSVKGLNIENDLPGFLTSQRDRLDGPAMRGTLIGGAPPPLDFLWVSGDRKWKSLDDLKGKVVVLDFWATWCGPCVGSFPNVRELVAHYAGCPVEVIGVTSVQGAHFDDGKSIDCKDDPAKEFGLMAEYIPKKEITWAVAFTKQPVYNPAYGIQGIPHVVIIDAAGKVRYSGLHPARPLSEKTSKIDALLREAGLPMPGAK